VLVVVVVMTAVGVEVAATLVGAVGYSPFRNLVL